MNPGLELLPIQTFFQGPTTVIASLGNQTFACLIHNHSTKVAESTKEHKKRVDQVERHMVKIRSAAAKEIKGVKKCAMKDEESIPSCNFLTAQHQMKMLVLLLCKLLYNF